MLSFNQDQGVQFVISIVRASNWENDGVFTVKLGLQEIAGISQTGSSSIGQWCYTLWTGENRNPKTGYATRFDAAFAAVSHHLRNQENRRETCEPG